MFRAPWWPLAKFCSFPKPLPSPSLVAALMRLLTGGQGRAQGAWPGRSRHPAPLRTPRPGPGPYLREGAGWLELLGGAVSAGA